jgi:hypothetical protein
MQQVLEDEPEHDKSAEVLGQLLWVPARAMGRTAVSATAILENECIVQFDQSIDSKEKSTSWETNEVI